jgi:hypothetical protein
VSADRSEAGARVHVGIGAVVVFVVAAGTLWASSQATRRCGWFDAQISACARPFTTDEARDGRAKFELFVDPGSEGTPLVGFAVTNNNASERSLAWTDVELETRDGREIDCYWGDDSEPRLGPMPGERVIADRRCVAAEGGLRLLYRGAEVARLD